MTSATNLLLEADAALRRFRELRPETLKPDVFQQRSWLVDAAREFIGAARAELGQLNPYDLEGIRSNLCTPQPWDPEDARARLLCSLELDLRAAEHELRELLEQQASRLRTDQR